MFEVQVFSLPPAIKSLNSDHRLTLALTGVSVWASFAVSPAAQFRGEKPCRLYRPSWGSSNTSINRLGQARLEGEKNHRLWGETGETCSEIEPLPSITDKYWCIDVSRDAISKAKKLSKTHTVLLEPAQPSV